METNLPNPNEETPPRLPLEERKPYSKPTLTRIGDLRALTLGASLGDFIDSSYSDDLPLQFI